jgi:hypothetical protein
MKKFIFLMVLVALILPIIGTATQINEKMGPYNINFSTPANIYTTLRNNTKMETYEGVKFQMYNLSIFDKKTNLPKGVILIIHQDNPRVSDIHDIETQLDSAINSIRHYLDFQ